MSPFKFSVSLKFLQLSRLEESAITWKGVQIAMKFRVIRLEQKKSKLLSYRSTETKILWNKIN